MTATIAHQYGQQLGDKVAAVLPPGVAYIALGDRPETAWVVPAVADVLLVNQNSTAIGLTRDMPMPKGWPFNLRWVHLRSTGMDKYPDWILQVPQVTVTRGGYAIPIAEFVLAAMLAHAKAIPTIWATSKEQWTARDLGGLWGETLGIIGFGEIGKAVAQRALAFGMSVVGTNRSGRPSDMDGVDIVPLEALLRCSDHIVVATPLTAATRGLIGAAALAEMKPGAHLINIGRGPVIDTEALRHALDDHLGAATLDVTDPEPLPDGHWLYSHPKVRISPHVSGSSPHTEHTVTAFFLDNLSRYISRQPLVGLVDPQARY